MVHPRPSISSIGTVRSDWKTPEVMFQAWEVKIREDRGRIRRRAVGRKKAP